MSEAVNVATKEYIDFGKVKVNERLVLSIKDSGKTVDQIKAGEKVTHVISMIFTYLFILALALLVIFPFYWMIITSLKTFDEIVSEQQTFFPTVVMWSNYVYVFQHFNFLTYMKNTENPVPYLHPRILYLTIFSYRPVGIQSYIDWICIEDFRIWPLQSARQGSGPAPMSSCLCSCLSSFTLCSNKKNCRDFSVATVFQYVSGLRSEVVVEDVLWWNSE